jgi:hypothetical protein
VGSSGPAIEVDAVKHWVIGKISRIRPPPTIRPEGAGPHVAVDGEPTPTWSELQLAVAKANQTVDLAIVRDSQTVHQKATTSINKELGLDSACSPQFHT